ncbi:Lactose permease like protein [Verticillium longisporum]|nr:Lactose permease like protein [Verticillium longisporum]CRK31648.1 hypothetical protein BN1708_015999 [Verticillium longisporum]
MDEVYVQALWLSSYYLLLRVSRRMRWALDVGSQSYEKLTKLFRYFACGRFMLGFVVSFCLVSAAYYVSEMSHPKWRGYHTGLYNCMLWLGATVASWTIFGCSKWDNPYAFRIPIWGQLFSSIIVGVGVFFVPESPRWLIANGKIEQARAMLAKYHGEGQENHPVVRLQMEEMKHSIKQDASDKRWWDYRELGSTRSARRRLIYVLGMAAFGQLSGNSITGSRLTSKQSYEAGHRNSGSYFGCFHKSLSLDVAH